MKHLALLALLIPALLAADAPKKAEEKKPKPVNALCPVTDEAIDPKQTALYKGKTVGFCCADCAAAFKKEPAKYAKKVEAEEAKAKKADKDKPKGEQPAADGTPVNKMCPVEKDLGVDPSTATVVYQGKTVGFCCDDCVKKFERDPDAFAAELK